jgi:hypothetical protein
MVERRGGPAELAKAPTLRRRMVRSAMGAVVGSLAAVTAVIVIGLAAWDAVRGLNSVFVAGVVGGGVGAGLRGLGDWPARAVGGLVGGAVAGFFTVAAAESSRPGTTEWAMAGGIVGAGLGAAVAAIMGAVTVLFVAWVQPRN